MLRSGLEAVVQLIQRQSIIIARKRLGGAQVSSEVLLWVKMRPQTGTFVLSLPPETREVRDFEGFPSLLLFLLYPATLPLSSRLSAFLRVG